MRCVEVRSQRHMGRLIPYYLLLGFVECAWRIRWNSFSRRFTTQILSRPVGSPVDPFFGPEKTWFSRARTNESICSKSSGEELARLQWKSRSSNQSIKNSDSGRVRKVQPSRWMQSDPIKISFGKGRAGRFFGVEMRSPDGEMAKNRSSASAHSRSGTSAKT